MEIKTNAKVLSAESKPYDFGGNKGVSHRIRLSIDGEIYVCKSNESQVNSLKEYVGEDHAVVLKLLSRKEALSLELTDIN